MGYATGNLNFRYSSSEIKLNKKNFDEILRDSTAGARAYTPIYRRLLTLGCMANEEVLNAGKTIAPLKFKSRFDEKESVSGTQQLKSSVQKGIRTKIIEYYPEIEPYIDLVLPKKENFKLVKCHDHIEILVNSTGDQLFFKHREGAWFPTLKLLHKFPFMLPQEQVDKGAIKFVLSGANVMCPGLCSRGGRIAKVPDNTIVAIMAEGKQHALGVGITTLSGEEIEKVGRGVGIELVHYLNDGLWSMKPVK